MEADDIDISTYDPNNHEEWVQRLHAYIKAKGYRVWNDPVELLDLAEKILAAHPSKVEAYRKWKRGLLGFFIAEIMRETKSGANPEMSRSLFESLLDP